MDRSTPVRKPHTSTADLLTWSETPLPSAPPESASRRTNKPASGISPVMFGGQMSEEEAEKVLKSAAKPCSGYKLREITGSGIFAADGENGTSESGSAAANSNNKTGVRIYQQAVTGMSQISFNADETVTPKKPVTLPEVAKQRELSGNLESESEAKLKKQLSELKFKELSGHDIFGPPPEVPPRPLAARNLELKGHLDFGTPSPRTVHTSVKVSNPSGGHSSDVLFGEEPEIKTTKKIHDQKFQELTGNNIFKGENQPGSAEKPLSSAKLKEMSGSNIFADGKPNSRKYYGGDRKPPGGESSIALV